jgi:phage gpG-like protein
MANISIDPRSGSGGASFQVYIDTRGIRANMSKLNRLLSDRTEPLVESAVEYMAKDVIKHRFEEEGIPKWKKLSPSTIRRRLKLGYSSGPILQMSGALKQSATGGSGFVYSVSGDNKAITFGSSLEYAHLHDQPRGTLSYEGGSAIPGRPWSYITDGNIKEVLNIHMKWVEKKMSIVGHGTGL